MKRFMRNGCATGLVLLALLVVSVLTARLGLYPFLARQAPVATDTLVIEGWLPDPVLAQLDAWLATNAIKRIYTTGGPLETGSYLIAWTNYADLTRARLIQLGYDQRYELTAVPAPKVRRDRTRESARALRAVWPLERGAFNLVSEGPHTRRSWRAFQQVFGDGVEVGSIALVPEAYDARDWWTCSEGLRTVLTETFGYIYDRLFGAP